MVKIQVKIQVKNTLNIIGDNSANYNVHYYVINEKKYLIIPTLPCDPFTINSITFNIDSTTITLSNTTYLPNGPKNGYEGYVFQINQNAGFDFNIHATNFNCSTDITNTLIIENSGNTEISTFDNVFVINSLPCKNRITHIIYNGINYEVILYLFASFGFGLLVNGNLNTNDFFYGSIQCI